MSPDSKRWNDLHRRVELCFIRRLYDRREPRSADRWPRAIVFGALGSGFHALDHVAVRETGGRGALSEDVGVFADSEGLFAHAAAARQWKAVAS